MKLDVRILDNGDLQPVNKRKLLERLEPGMLVTAIVETPDAPRSHPQNALYRAWLRWATRGGNIREEIEDVVGRLSEEALHEILKVRQGLESTAFASASPAVFTAFFEHVQTHECLVFCGCEWEDAYAEIVAHR